MILKNPKQVQVKVYERQSYRIVYKLYGLIEDEIEKKVERLIF